MAASFQPGERQEGDAGSVSSGDKCRDNPWSMAEAEDRHKCLRPPQHHGTHCRAPRILPVTKIYLKIIWDYAIICTGQHDSSLCRVNDYTFLAVSFEHTQVGKGSKHDFTSFCLDSGAFPVAKQSCPLSSNTMHQSHTDNIFSATTVICNVIFFLKHVEQAAWQGRWHSSMSSPTAGKVSSLWGEHHNPPCSAVPGNYPGCPDTCKQGRCSSASSPASLGTC